MLDSLPNYLAFLATGVLLIAGSLAIYMTVTPYREITLIRQGNAAAAVSLGGTVIGLAIVLNSVAQGTYQILDLALWGAVGLVCQLAVFFVVSLSLPGFKQGIEDAKLSYGVALAALSIAMGILNAGSLST